MAQADLYSLLCGYTGKTKSPSITIREFLAFIEKFAAQKPPGLPEWTPWVFNAEARFREKISALVENGQCILLIDGKDEKVFLPALCRGQINDAYKDADRLADVTFPNEESLRLKLPDGFARTVNLLSGMGLFFTQSENSPDPGDVICLNFPQNFGNALLLAGMIPRKLMEMSLLKVRHYMNVRKNGEYVFNKMIGQMLGKEKALRDMIDQIMVNPLSCLSEMERSADFPYLFWAFFCPLIKNDIMKKNELLAGDMAALQAVCVIEVCCGFYRTAAAKKREKDAAFLTLEVLMDRAPWRYTLEEIIGFTNDRGISLLDIYSQDDLEDYILKSVNEGKSGELPPWLVVHGGKGERWFIKKGRYLSVCAKMLIETQPAIKAAITKRWHGLIRNYDNEPAMESDAEFEKLLRQQTGKINPVLQTVLDDIKLRMVHEEMARVQNAAAPLPIRIFKSGELLPHSALFSLRRKDMLSGIRLQMPFWYSIPPIIAIIRFFKNPGKKKTAKKQADNGDALAAVGQESTELSQSARLVESAIVPKGKTLEEYLAELERKWALLIDKKARQNLIIDVQSLLRDNLRNAMKVYKLKRISRESLKEMSATLVSRSQGLQKVRDQESLRLYMELFTLKLLLQR